MSHLYRSLPLKGKVSLIIITFVVGLLIFASLSVSTLKTVSVNGPMYNRIILHKDLVADILPPPEYIIESYLVSFQCMDETNMENLQKLADRCKQLKAEYDERHEFWLTAELDPKLKQTLTVDSYKPAVEFFKQLNERYLPALIAGEQDKALGILRNDLRNAYTAHRAAIDQTVVLANEASDGEQQNASDTILSSNRMLIIVGLTVTLCNIFFGWMLSHHLLRGIKSMIARIKDIAQGDGNLTKRVEIESNDEIGELGKWFNEFIQKVHDIVTEVTIVTHDLASNSSQIAAANEQMSQGMSQQTNQTTQISSAVEQMSSTVTEVSRKSTDAVECADEAGRQANEGGQIVKQTVSGIQQISRIVNESAIAINDLGKRGEQIGQIINIINDIADQTNLLALNAAIEAARAGEQGRGFAVVADEVRKLAERTTNATDEIAQSIRAIQEETSSAVSRMNDGIVSVDEGVELAQQAGKSLHGIVESTQKVALMIQSIAASTEEQASASAEIARSIESINTVAHQSSISATQTSQTTMDLSEKAKHLESLVGRFEIKQTC